MRKTFRTASAAALFLAAIPLVAAAPLSAGIVLKQTMKSEGETAMSQTTRMSLDTGGAKIEFLDGNNPMMPAGSYMLIQPDNDALILVNPEKKSWSEFDLAAMSQAMSGMMGGAGGGDQKGAGERKYSKPVVEKLLEEAGETILGRPTKHFQYHLKWSTTMEMAPGMALIMENDSIEDTWVATDIKIDPKIARSFQGFGAGMSMPKELEEIAAAQKQVFEGVPMRRIQKGTVKMTGTGMMAAMAKSMSKHSDKPTTTTFEVVELSEEKVPASVFSIPAGFTETELMNPGMKMPDMSHPN